MGYGWLGAKQRSTTAETAGLTLMGDRLYDAATGRFTSMDPEPGGNENAYAYPDDPMNRYDLNGRWSFWGAVTAVTFVATVASFVPGLDVIAAPIAVAGSALLTAHDLYSCARHRSWGGGCTDLAIDVVGFGVGKVAGKAFKAYQKSRALRSTRAIGKRYPKGIRRMGGRHRSARRAAASSARRGAAHRVRIATRIARTRTYSVGVAAVSEGRSLRGGEQM